MKTSTQKHIFIDITLVDMKLWSKKEDGVVRQLPALPGVIANAFQCNGCVRLPNFDLLIISSSVERIFVVSYLFTTDPYTIANQRVNVINMALVAMETTAVRHYPIITKT